MKYKSVVGHACLLPFPHYRCYQWRIAVLTTPLKTIIIVSDAVRHALAAGLMEDVKNFAKKPLEI
jgi:hypothetical protein